VLVARRPAAGASIRVMDRDHKHRAAWGCLRFRSNTRIGRAQRGATR